MGMADQMFQQAGMPGPSRMLGVAGECSNAWASLL